MFYLGMIIGVPLGVLIFVWIDSILPRWVGNSFIFLFIAGCAIYALSL